MYKSILGPVTAVLALGACAAREDVSQLSAQSRIDALCAQDPGVTTSAGGGWANELVPQQYGPFSEVQFAATPVEASNGRIDAVIGLANGPAARFTDLGPIVRFSPSGRFDARDGGAYRAETDLSYATDGTQYLITLALDFSAHTYTATVGHYNDPFPVTIARDYAFRTEQATMSRADSLTREIDSPTGSLAICGYAGSAQSHASTAGSGWGVTPFRPESGVFQVDVEATPQRAGSDAVVGLSATTPTRFTDLAAIARFSPAGVIDVRDGDNYRADAQFVYSPTETYHLIFDVDVPAGTYSVTVWDTGAGIRTQIATNYAFRIEQQAVTSLGVLGQYVDGATGGVDTSHLLEKY